MFSAPTRTSVRRAAIDDVRDVLRLFVENLWPIAHFEPSMQAVGMGIWNAVNEGRVFVAERDGEIIGCAAYADMQFWYMDKPQMWDQGIFVVEKYRKSRAAFMLDKALKDEAEARGMTLLYAANTQNPDAGRIMNKRYRKISEVFVVRE